MRKIQVSRLSKSDIILTRKSCWWFTDSRLEAGWCADNGSSTFVVQFYFQRTEIGLLAGTD